MQTWVESDGQGRQFLVRCGTGVVTAVVPAGSDPGRAANLCRIEIHCDAPHGRPGAIRYSVHPLVEAGQPLHQAAVEAFEQGWPVGWTVQWHRHDWIPGDLPIASLDLTTDARSLLAGLDRAVVPEQHPEALVPGFVPVPWQDSRS